MTRYLAVFLLLLTVPTTSCKRSKGSSGPPPEVEDPEPLNESDLTVTEVDASQVVTDAASLLSLGTVTARIDNLGTGPASSFGVSVFEDRNGDQALDASDALLAHAPVDGLGTGETLLISVDLAATSLFPGNFIHVFVDSEEEIDELDEANNVDRSARECIFQPQPGLPFELFEEWNWTSTPSSPAPQHHQVMMAPVVINLNDDNGDGRVDELDVPDVVFGAYAGGNYSTNGILRAVNGRDGSQIFETALDSNEDIVGAGSLAVADIDGDSLPEIIAVEDTSDGRGGHRLIAFENDGTFKFSSDAVVGQIYWGGPSIADLNQDGTPEIVVGATILSNTGSLIASGSSRRGDNTVGPLSTVADIDLDGRPEIVAGSTVYDVEVDEDQQILALNVQWEATNASGGAVGDGFPGIGNFDQDPQAEVVLVSSGNVWLFDDDGSHLWGPVRIPGGGRGGAPNIDDFDGDGEPEVGTAGGRFYVVLDTDGSQLWSSPTFDTSSNVTGSSVFDFEGDGKAEVVYKDQTNLRVYRGSDGLILADVATGSGTTYENPLIVDIDRDGNAEIVICANDYAYGTRRGIQVFGDAADQWVNTRRIWNQHTYHVTNIEDDGTIPAVEENSWQRYNTFRSQQPAPDVGVFDAPDLTASFLSASECSGGIEVQVRVGNGGIVLAEEQLKVAFYHGNPDSGGILLGVGETSRRLGPGEFEDVRLLLDFNGTVQVFAVADDDGTGRGSQSECDEINNICNSLLEGCPDP
jgi:hypothetical protein